MLETNRIERGIMLGVLAWGAMLALGAYLNFTFAGHPVRNWTRPFIVLGCVLGFLAFWAVALRLRARRIAKETDDSAFDHEDGDSYDD